MKMKKIIALALSLVTVASCLSFTACKKNDIVKDGKTVNVMMSKGGYGVDYIEDVAAKFEEAYAAEKCRSRRRS